MLQELNKLSNESLIARIKDLKNYENITVADIVLYLSELDERKLYRDLGYSSLFSYCAEGLGYSESAAYRRIQAARALKNNPEIYELIKSGKVSLCAVSEISKVKEDTDKKKLLIASEGKSRRQVQALTAGFLLPSKSTKESIKVKKVAASDAMLELFNQPNNTEEAYQTKYSISIEVDKEFMDLLNEAKSDTGHVPTSEVFKRALKEYVGKRKKASKRNSINRAKKQTKHTRYIPVQTRKAVIKRDNHQCTFMSPDGRRCTESHALQVDHIVPTSLGGSNEISNLRLLCRAHNLFEAERFFGKQKIESYFKREARGYAR